MTRLQTNKQRSGAVAMLMILGIMVVVMIVMISVSTAATSNLQSTQASTSSAATFAAAEAGLNQTIYRLRNLPPLPVPCPNTSPCVDVLHNPDGTVIPIAISSVVIPDGFYRRIETVATNTLSKSVRKLSVNIKTSTFAGGFAYAIQTGIGGSFAMEIGAEILGDVFSNGNIYKSKNGVPMLIRGDVYLAQGSSISGIDKVQGNIYAENSGMIIPPNPIDPGTGTFIQKTLSPKPLPFQKPDIDNWINAVSTTPITCGNPCSGPIGPGKISGDVKINGNLTVKGTVFIEGKLIINGGSTINVDVPSPGNMGIIIVRDTITVENNVTFPVSGNQFVMLLTTYESDPTDLDDVAILARNNAKGVVYYAKDGVLKVLMTNEKGLVNAALAKTIHIVKSAVEFVPILTSIFIPSSGVEIFEVDPNSWKDL